MPRTVSYGLAISEEQLGDTAPVLFQGGLEAGMRRAAGLGFDSVEIHIRDPLKVDPDRLQEVAAKNRLRIAAIGTGLEYSLNGLSLTSPDQSVRARMFARYLEHIDLGARLDAVVFIGMCRGKAPHFSDREVYLDRLAGELVPIAAYAAERGVVLALEPIVFYLTNLLNTTEETLAFLDRPGLKTIQLLLDTHHIFIEDRELEKSFRDCAGRISHVHISDSNRRYPGGGNIDYARVGAVLKETGYCKAVSLEVLPYPDGGQAARNGISWMKSVWGE